jgi:hypothetical protein
MGGAWGSDHAHLDLPEEGFHFKSDLGKHPWMNLAMGPQRQVVYCLDSIQANA